jgi:hypothetical protein
MSFAVPALLFCFLTLSIPFFFLLFSYHRHHCVAAASSDAHAQAQSDPACSMVTFARAAPA